MGIARNLRLKVAEDSLLSSDLCGTNKRLFIIKSCVSSGIMRSLNAACSSEFSTKSTFMRVLFVCFFICLF